MPYNLHLKCPQRTSLVVMLVNLRPAGRPGDAFLNFLLAGGKYTGAAINPARLIAPALVFFCTPQRAFWLYLVGQLAGAALGGVVATGTFGAAAAAPNDDMGERSSPGASASWLPVRCTDT